ncbi:hypothetical protein J2S43_004496 [Catenuloplanes nepalensis]|uniref:Uncharacterized protein n=1 Tax=Catenuloplanes nepalensis TaxID=587533 RepID=A0ABT9MX16_9ACTN|nr:hypothetical protein [Catenuloplanes nepalensis]MDP9795984.1 hypothetical protein [Catenuloplanes nepalensis]
MTSDLDALLSESLRARADAGAPIAPDALLRGAVVRGRRVRTHRRIAAFACAVVVLAGVGTAAGLLAPHRDSSAPVVATPAPSPLPSRSPAVNDRAHRDLAVLPDAGLPGAVARPDLVGADPAVLHFSVDALARDAAVAGWRSAAGVESARVIRGDLDLSITLARDAAGLPPSIVGEDLLSEAADVRVGAGPGTVRVAAGLSHPPRDGEWSLYRFDWQPADGLWARAEVQMPSQELALAAVGHVRLDQSRRLMMPFRIGAVPAGATERERGVELRTDGPGLVVSATARLVAGRRELSVQSGTPQGQERPDGAWVTAGPHRVYAPDGGYYGVESRGQSLDVLAVPRTDPLPRADVLAFVAGMSFAERLDDPGTWL